MKIFTKKDKRNDIEKEIERITKILSSLDPITDKDKYNDVANSLTELKHGRSYDKEPDKVSKDVVVTGLFGLAGIVIMVGYEHGHTITSKAISFIIKGRI